jgi:hypothetical protein
MAFAEKITVYWNVTPLSLGNGCQGFETAWCHIPEGDRFHVSTFLIRMDEVC